MRLFLPLALLLAATLAFADPPAKPTGVVAYAPNERQVHLSWKDVDGETQYWIDRQDLVWVEEGEEGEGQWVEEWSPVGTLGSDFEVFRGVGFSTDEKVVKYRICAVKGIEASDWVEAVVTKPSGALDLFLKPGILAENPEDPENPTYAEPPLEISEGISAVTGEVVTYQIQVFGGERGVDFVDYVARDLPSPMWSVDYATGKITGIAPAPGVYRFFIGAKIDNERQFEQVRFLRVLPAASIPEVATPSYSLPKQRFGVSGFLNLSEIFRDPKRPRGAWFYTNEGSVIVALHDTATPKTVANFLGYAERGDYDNTFVHRSVSSPTLGMIQGGGYWPFSATSAPNQWRAVTAKPSVFNEPGISNTRRTISMAKLGSNRDSATSQWFFNFANNAPNLDYQNGGFTAFGEVVGSAGMQTVDRIAGLATSTYSISVSYSTSSFSDLPVRASVAPPSLAWKDLVFVHSVVPAPPVEISLVSNSAPQVLNASVDGMLLFIESRGKVGTAQLRLRATNLDGNTVDFVLPITVADLDAPTFRLTSLRSVRPYGTVQARGRAKDDVGLGKWRYRINNKGWKNGGKLKGKSAVMNAKMRGFKQGRNLIRIEVFDAKKNRSGVLKLRVTFR